MKTNLIKILCICSCLSFYLGLNAQTKLDLPQGKCQEKCLMAALYDRFEVAVPIYIGDDENIIDKFIKDTSFVTKERRTEWIKKKKDRECFSKDPNDCLTWCLVEVQAEKVQISDFLIDTTVTTEYVLEYYMFEELIDSRGFVQWQEVVCPNRVSGYLINQIRNALGMSNAYEYDDETMKRLVEYQRLNGLPVGEINIKTLEHLGIDSW